MKTFLPIVSLIAFATSPCFGGDFNGDGVDDLAIGVPDAEAGGNHDTGRVQIVFGSPTGLDPTNIEFLSDLTLAFPGHPSSNFGAALAHGDFDGDGFDDLAIGAPGTPVTGLSGAGAVYVVPGFAQGMNSAATTIWSQDTPGIKDKVEPNAYYIAASAEYFGSELATGDFNGDGFDDLAITVMETIKKNAAYAGAVHVLFGSATGLRATKNQLWHLDSKGVPGKGVAGGSFGEALTSGDFDGDGFDDLVVFSHAHFDVDTWDAILVLRGSKKGLVTKGRKWFAPDGDGTLDDDYGSLDECVAAGDLDGDGFEDLVLGVPLTAVNGENASGAVRIFRGSTKGVVTSAFTQFARGQASVAGAAEAQARFGSALAIGDVDDDGLDDVIVGAYGSDIGAASNAGSIHVFLGDATTLLSLADDTIWSKDTAGVADVATAGDEFGRALATGDFDGDGHGDVAVGAPFEAIGVEQKAGAMHVLRGSPTGITATSDQYLTMVSLGLTPKKWDHFAAALN